MFFLQQEKCPSKRFIFLASSLGWTYVATVFVIVGLCTNYWLEIRKRNLYNEDILVHFGLHRVCWKSTNKCIDPGSSYDKDSELEIKSMDETNKKYYYKSWLGFSSQFN